MDLAVLYRQRRWVYLLDLIDNLPQASRLSRAMMNDPEVAEQILAMAEAEGENEWNPPLSEYDLKAQYLAQIVDGLSSLQSTLVAVNGGKPERPRPIPRPKTQIDVIRERRSQERQNDIIALFAPHALR